MVEINFNVSVFLININEPNATVKKYRLDLKIATWIYLKRKNKERLKLIRWTSYQIGWPLSKRHETKNVGEGVEKRGPPTLWVGM